VIDVDTDVLGTLTGEVPRTSSPIETAIAKARPRDLPPLQPVTAIRVLPPSDEVAVDACREVAQRK
jgi:hypothetical protein